MGRLAFALLLPFVILLFALSAFADQPAAAPPKSKGTIVVPAAVVAKAIEKRDISASNATTPDGKPAGAKVHGVSKYKTGLRDGDIIISVSGQRVDNTQSLVSAAMGQVMNGATKLTGKIRRGEEVWDVVLEIPQR